MNGVMITQYRVVVPDPAPRDRSPAGFHSNPNEARLIQQRGILLGWDGMKTCRMVDLQERGSFNGDIGHCNVQMDEEKIESNKQKNSR